VIAVVYHRVVQQQTTVTGLAASMTILGMGLGNGLVVGDMFILDLNLATVQTGLHCSASTCVFIACLADLTLAATVLGAGVLGDKYGAKRMFIAGACGAGVFGLLAAAAPNAAVMIVARACIGMAFAFLCSLSLAIINAVFPVHQRAKAIAQYLAVIYVFGVAPPAIASLLVKNAGWRSGFLITAVLAILVVAITLRYVPETQRTDSKVDVPGLLLVAAALVGLIYGISKLENGLQFAALVPIAIGVLAGVAFVWWERRTDEPALDLGIFRSPRFDAAVIAGAAGRFVEAGGLIMVGYYLIILRGTSTQTFALMIIPAALLSAVAALGAGRAAARLGVRTVMVAGLMIVTLSLLLRRLFEVDTPIVAVAAVVALTAIGGAIVHTPQVTIMMSSVPTSLGGVVSAIETSVASASTAIGGSLFALLSIALFDRHLKLSDSGITGKQALGTLRVAHAPSALSAPGDGLADPQQVHKVIAEASSSMIDAAHELNLIMTVVPVTAIVLAIVLFLRETPRETRQSAAH
jgi:MFS family permease